MTLARTPRAYLALLAMLLLQPGLVSPALAQAPVSTEGLSLWALPAGAAASPDSRDGWRRLDAEANTDRVPAGGLAVETGNLMAILPAGGRAIEILCPVSPKADIVRQELVLLDDRGQVAGQLADVAIVKHDAGEVVIGLAAGKARASLKLVLGRGSVEVMPGRGAGSLRICGPARYSFIPDFFGHDILYDPREIGAKAVYAPAESFLINLLEGHGALTMITWPAGGSDEVMLLPEGEGAGRRLGATQIRFAGKSIFVTVRAGEGIWYEQDLRAAAKDKTFAVEGWRPPFPAQWMTILAKRPAVGAKSGLASETLPVKSLPAEGDTPYSDVYYHPRVPTWFTGPQWRLHLETTLTHMMTHEKVPVPEYLLAINYPRDRVKETPLTAFTLVDVMRDTLGAGPCQYILDLEGLNKTRSAGAAGTGKPVASATCSERGALVFYYLGERSEYPRRDEPLIATRDALVSVEKIKDFLDAAHARIQEYLLWSDQVIQLAEEAKARNPQATDLAQRVIVVAKEMRILWNKMVEQNKPCAFPMEWRMALDHCKDLIRENGEDLGARIREFDPQMRGAGEEVDGGMQACRMIVKRIGQEAALAGSEDPEVMKLAAAIRQRCREILRNKHYKEGDSVQLGAGSEGRR